MPTVITPLVVSRDGSNMANVTTLAAGDVSGMSFANDGRTFLVLRNASGGALTALLVLAVDGVPVDIDGVTVPLRTLTVPAAHTRIFGPFPRESYGGTVVFTPSNASLTVCALKISSG